MKWFYNFLMFLQSEMETPKPYGWFHLLCILLVIISIIYLYKKRNNYNEKHLKKVLLIYGVIAFILEMLKQISWSFNYDMVTNSVIWDFQWYSFPFQLCTTPIYVSLICGFMKNNKIRKALLSYLSFVTILGSIATIIIPDSCFVSDILVNIHTMWLHCGSLVVSVYLMIVKEVKLNFKNLKKAVVVFLIFVIIALLMNITVYNSGILNGEEFNMFYISPYFISTLPLFCVIQEMVPYPLFLTFYVSVIILGAFVIYFLASKFKELICKVNGLLKI